MANTPTKPNIIKTMDSITSVSTDQVTPTPKPILTLSEHITIRPYHKTAEEAIAIAKGANNKNLWLNMTDRFPHPYTVENAYEWMDIALDKANFKSTQEPTGPAHVVGGEAQRLDAELLPTAYAICYDDFCIGGTGLLFRDGADKTLRYMAELGYWISEDYWGHGIGTLVATAFSNWAMNTYPWLMRLEANVFHWNEPSMKVLKKAGFVFEGVHKAKCIKEGVVVDLWYFAKVRDGIAAGDIPV